MMFASLIYTVIMLCVLLSFYGTRKCT